MHAERVTFVFFFFTLSQMCTTSYVCMQVSRNLADNNTPQLCLIFYLSGEHVTSLSPLVLVTRTTHCVCSCTCHRDPAQTCRKIILQAQAVIHSILLRYLSAYRLEFGFNSRRQFKGYVCLLQVKSAMIIFVFLLRESRRKACLFA